MCGPGLKGSTIGLVGFGRIGQEVCRKLKAFNVAKILYTDSGKKSKTEGKRIPAYYLLVTRCIKSKLCLLKTPSSSM